ncbi:hypothetical protein JOE66_000551 [Subtercola frigoramans]|uniref:DUF4389 domain-containing protein n=1 Tax=Subtercola frigoramans TaxID=120298 RepID=A0ABS2L1H0_9MICO|nr:hypothetical protein [Subtercola frigoramans]
MERSRLNWVGALTLLIVRSLALWLLIPLGFIVWLFVGYSLDARGATLGHWLGWLDQNFVVFMIRCVVRPFLHGPPPRYTPWSRIEDVDHRIKLFDAY